MLFWKPCSLGKTITFKTKQGFNQWFSLSPTGCFPGTLMLCPNWVTSTDRLENTLNQVTPGIPSNTEHLQEGSWASKAQECWNPALALKSGCCPNFIVRKSHCRTNIFLCNSEIAVCNYWLIAQDRGVFTLIKKPSATHQMYKLFWGVPAPPSCSFCWEVLRRQKEKPPKF